jgi:hypothetical protein
MGKILTIAAMVGLMGLLVPAAWAEPPAQSKVPPAGVPQWIKDGKVRSSYSNQWDSEDLPGKLAAAGFNTMLIQFCNGTGYFEKWDRLTRENNLHFFTGIWIDYPAYYEVHYGHAAGIGSTYRRFVHRDQGPRERVVCPVDEGYWRDWIMPTPQAMARLGQEHGRLEGIIIDAELYAASSAEIPASFYMDLGPCLCDVCFGDFLERTYVGRAKEKPANLPWPDRYGWLVQHHLTREYNIRLRDKVASLARQLRQQVHAINPDLLLGFMNWYKNDIGAGPHENYFLHGLLHGLQTRHRPVMVWTEYPEYFSGYGPHTDARREFFQSIGNVIYVPGLYLEEHAPNRLSQQVQDLATHSDGYWIFTLDTGLLLNSYILGRFKEGNDKIASAAPTASERPSVQANPDAPGGPVGDTGK